MNKVFDKLPALVAEELEAANSTHSLFHSTHEGYAVLLEEIDEARDEMAAIDQCCTMLWDAVRMDSPHVKHFAARIDRTALQAAAELIQVAAMARKMLMSLSPGPSGGEADEGR